jgi:ribose 5-phosphate isomerase RpiB
MVDAFINTKFSGDERHARRIKLIARYEETGEI